jgi:hypothetical protein
MRGTVGYLGWLWDWNGDRYASMKIGAAGSGAESTIPAAGGYSRFEVLLANDDEDPWDVRLYAQVGTTLYSNDFVTLDPGVAALVALDFRTTVAVAQVADMGFEVRGHFVPGGKPSNPDYFHISAAASVSMMDPPNVTVPAPGAFALTLFGLGSGLRWRPMRTIGLARHERSRRSRTPPRCGWNEQS